MFTLAIANLKVQEINRFFNFVVMNFKSVFVKIFD
jgi:hypothetical protein